MSDLTCIVVPELHQPKMALCDNAVNVRNKQDNPLLGLRAHGGHCVKKNVFTSLRRANVNTLNQLPIYSQALQPVDRYNLKINFTYIILLLILIPFSYLVMATSIKLCKLSTLHVL